MTMTDPDTDRIAIVRRRLNVAARFVFAAHAKGEHIMRWFGPVGYPVTQCDYDFRVDGNWRMIMTGPDGLNGPPFGGRFLTIQPDRQIVYTNAFEDGGAAMGMADRGPMIMDWRFDPAGKATDVTLTITFQSPAMKTDYLAVGMLEGIASGLDQYEPVAQELAAAG